MAPCLAVRGDLDTAGAGPQLRAPPGCHMQLSLPSKAEPGRARAATGRMGTVLLLTRPRQVRAELQITEHLQLDKMLPFPEHIQPRNTPDMLAVAAMCFHRSRQVSPRSWRMRCLVPSTCAGGVAGGHAAVSLISPAGCGCTAHSFQLEINLNLL